MCQVVVARTLPDGYEMAKAQQHRGREAAGMVAISDERIDAIKWRGKISRVDINGLTRIISDLGPLDKYHTFFFHGRYATKGRKEHILEDAHPQVIGGTKYEHNDHIVFSDVEAAIVHNGEVDKSKITRKMPGLASRLNSGVDSEALLHFYREHGAHNVLRQLPSSYTCAIADKKLRGNVIVLRDHKGMMPGVIGEKNEKTVIASENVAFTQTFGRMTQNLDPGSIYTLHPNGKHSVEKVLEADLRGCFFQLAYLAHRDSTVWGVPVVSFRRALGERLAEEFKPKDVDIITYVPRCPEDAAIAYAQKTGQAEKFEHVFYKMDDERSFQGSDKNDRENSIKNNLHISDGKKEALKGKNVLVMEDSIVRGNNFRRTYNLLQEAGVNKIYLLSFVPQIGIINQWGDETGCEWGIDNPPKPTHEDYHYIARDHENNTNRSVSEISKLMGAQVHYMSTGGLLGVCENFNLPREELCYFCIGGPHPLRK